MSERLDVALVQRGLARSRTAAQVMVAEGEVRLNGRTVVKPATQVLPADDLAVTPVHRWVSRGAQKLLGALDELDPDGQLVSGAVVLDAGACTGGFTQVCLERGARRVHAVDVGHDQLAPSLRSDPRVVVTEGFNLRHLTPQTLPEPIDLVVCDVSFISLRLLLGPLLSALGPQGHALLMVKPQFEVGRERLGAGGVVSDPQLQAQAVQQVIDDAAELGWSSTQPRPARLPGAHGNQEFFILLSR